MWKKYMILFIFLNIHIIRADSEIGAESLLESNVNEPICTTPGAKCQNCWTSLNCIDLGNNTFHPNLQYCPMGRSCKNKTGLCEFGGNYECSDLDKLKCHMEGVFPSPFNNMEYITCVRGSDNTLLKFISRCSPSYIFDPIIKVCTKQIGYDSYSSLVPVCKFENETGAIEINPNIFYRCEKETVNIGFNFIPEIYRCDFNLKFNGTDCIGSEFIYNFDFNENDTCFRSGNFPHPTNSKKYYNCESAGSFPIAKSCSSSDDEKFSMTHNKCINEYFWGYNDD